MNKSKLKEKKCIVCRRPYKVKLETSRVLTCSKECSKVYTRISERIRKLINNQNLKGGKS